MESQNKISYQPNICIIGFNGNNVNNIIDGYGLFFEIIKENLWFAIERMFFPLVNEEEFIEKVFYDEVSGFINEKSVQPTIVFAISDFYAARSAPVKDFIDWLEKVSQQKEDVFVYNIIFDMLGEFKLFNHGYHGENMGSEEDAFSLNALPCFYNCSRFSSGGYKRLVKLILRIAGIELIEPNFPNYSWETLSLMARHINRENFNSKKLRKGAIPAHGFDADGLPLITEEMLGGFERNIKIWTNNRPKLVAVQTYECPHCKYRINPPFRYWDKDAGIIQCPECENLADASELDFQVSSVAE